MDLLEFFNERKVDYDLIKSRSMFKFKHLANVDVSVVIPVRGRKAFIEPVVRHLKKAFGYSTKTFHITIVEHADERELEALCDQLDINYIWVSGEGQPFNKCLSFNAGFLFSNRADYYLFHDVDILMTGDFFGRLFENMVQLDQGPSAVQTFAEQRVCYMNDILTQEVIAKDVFLEALEGEVLNGIIRNNIRIGDPGAPGGSILVPKDLFLQVGGFDPEYFWAYAPEDRFFFDKLALMRGIVPSNNPRIEQFHMHHPPMHKKNPDLKGMEDICKKYVYLSDEKKFELIKAKSEHLMKYHGPMEKETAFKAEVHVWASNNGDKTLRLNYPLTPDSIVFDVGGYHGNWASDIYCKYGCKVVIFEPVKEFYDICKERFAHNDNIKVIEAGLGAKEETIQINVDDDASSTHKIGNLVDIKIKTIDDYLFEYSGIDLIKINIEGGEYELLEYLYERDFLYYIKNIQVQFHTFVENAEERRTNIQDMLSRTHELTYNYPFVWENWRLKC